MTRVTRRRFLEIGGLVSAGALIGLPPALGRQTSGHVSRTTGRPHLRIPSTCLGCYARCGIEGYLEYGRLVKLEGNKAHPNNRGRMCAKGQAGINALDDPERILAPLRRNGPRGSNRWKQVSWDEALGELASRMSGMEDPSGLAYFTERDITTHGLFRRFCGAFGTPYDGGDVFLGGRNKALACRTTYGTSLDVPDAAFTRYLLNFGSNPFEAHILRTSFVQRMTESREERVYEGQLFTRSKLVTFDPRVSQTAGSSDEWHPIIPGTDALVALAMTRTILRHNLDDADFIETWTNVSRTELAEILAPYTLERAERESGVPATAIERIALEFATLSPSVAFSSGGLNKHVNGFHSERCVQLLNIVTGNIDIRGGSCLPRRFDLGPETTGEVVQGPSYGPADYGLPAPPERALFERPLADRRPIDVLLMYAANPAYSNPELARVERVLRSEDLTRFVTVMDSTMSETAALADLILPTAGYLERLELESPPTLEFEPLVSVRQPMVPPRGQCRSAVDILLDLADRLGGKVSAAFPYDSEVQYWGAVAAAIPGLKKAGGLDYLRQEGLWVERGGRYAPRLFERQGFATPSGKIEIRASLLARTGMDERPRYEPVDAHGQMAEDDFHLITFQWNVHTHGFTANAMWLSEIVHNNPAWINRATADRLGIRQGDHIRLRSGTGEMEVEAFVTEGIHPRVIAVSDACGHWEYGRVAQAIPFESENPNTRLLWWQKEGKGFNPQAVIPLRHDPIGGGQGWMDGVVKIVGRTT